jgi:2,4-dienoyl-CoA reductase-like NADH-dependent reductase (Old Yellow Enzyme family)
LASRYGNAAPKSQKFFGSFFQKRTLSSCLNLPLPPTPFDPLRVGPITLRNRFIKSATNEAMTLGGAPSRALVEFHRAVAAGGAAMTTVAYLAISAAGRTLPNQIWLRPEILPALRALTDAVHAQGAAIAGQITHAGSFVTGMKVPGRTPSADGGVNKAGLLAGNFFQRAITPAEMDEIADQYTAGAILCRQAGFDAVEVHMGHGYLLNQFISPLSNHRNDAFGGDATARMRFPLVVFERVKQAVGNTMAVIAKINVADGVSGGGTVADGIVTAQLLERAGADLLVLSSGRNMESVWYMFGSKMNMPAMRAALGGSFLQRQFLRLAALGVPQHLEFQDNYRLAESRAIRAAVRMKLAYLGGAVALDNVQTLLAEGFEAVAMGRALLHDPNLVNRFAAGTATRSGCTHCNACVFSIYRPEGTACVLNPPNDLALNLQPAA